MLLAGLKPRETFEPPLIIQHIKEDCYSFCIAFVALLLSLLNVRKQITWDVQAWSSAVCWAGGGGRLWPVRERRLSMFTPHLCCMFRVKDFILHWNCSWSSVCRSIDTWGRVLLQGGGLVSGCLSWLRHSDLTDSLFLSDCVSLTSRLVKMIQNTKVIKKKMFCSLKQKCRVHVIRPVLFLSNSCLPVIGCSYSVMWISGFSKRNFTIFGNVVGRIIHQCILFPVLSHVFSKYNKNDNRKILPDISNWINSKLKTV